MLALTCAVACHDTPTAFAPAGATEAARTNANGFFTALEERFTNVQRSPRYAVARRTMARDAFAPSRVIDDTTVWNGTDPANDLRSLTVRGTFTDNRYILNDDRVAPVHPARPPRQRPVRVDDERGRRHRDDHRR
jgi:hypothetical protein